MMLVPKLGNGYFNAAHGLSKELLHGLLKIRGEINKSYTTRRRTGYGRE